MGLLGLFDKLMAAVEAIFEGVAEAAGAVEGAAAGAAAGAKVPPATPPASPTKKAGDPVAPCPLKKTKKKRKVIKITAKILATRSLHPPVRRIREIKKLRSSTSVVESLDANKPIVLVRGCNVLRLTAQTSPPGELVTWEVKPNENTESAPGFTTEKGNTIKLGTDKIGSFSVTATLDGTKVIWNVVFVWVKVNAASTVVKFNQSFAAGQTSADANFTSFAAGQFARGQNAMEATVSVNLIGGGTDGKRGLEQIKLGYLQDGTADTLTGHYDSAPGGGTGAETVVRPGTRIPATFPVVDAQGPPAGAGEPVVPAEEGGEMSPISTTDARIVQVTDKPAGAKGKNVEFWLGDSPVGSFARRHPKTKAFLTSITGNNSFRAAVGSFSLEAPQAVCAHADISWVEDYAGTVTPPPAATGVFTPTAGNHVTAGAAFALISDATGGSDAFDAGFELFAPRFNHSLITVFTP